MSLALVNTEEAEWRRRKINLLSLLMGFLRQISPDADLTKVHDDRGLRFDLILLLSHYHIILRPGLFVVGMNLNSWRSASLAPAFFLTPFPRDFIAVYVTLSVLVARDHRSAPIAFLSQSFRP